MSLFFHGLIFSFFRYFCSFLVLLFSFGFRRGLSNRFWPTRPASVYSESPNTHMAIPCEVIPEAEAEALATLEAVLNDHDTLTPR